MDLSYPVAWDIWACFGGAWLDYPGCCCKAQKPFGIYKLSQIASAIPLTKEVATKRPSSWKWVDQRGQAWEGANVVGDRGVDPESTSDWVVYCSTHSR